MQKKINLAQNYAINKKIQFLFSKISQNNFLFQGTFKDGFYFMKLGFYKIISQKYLKFCFLTLIWLN